MTAHGEREADQRPALTARQAECLAAVVASLRERGVPPTIQELQTALGCARNAAVGHVNALIHKGYVRRAATYQSRNLRVVLAQSPCPLCGHVAGVHPVSNS